MTARMPLALRSCLQTAFLLEHRLILEYTCLLLGRFQLGPSVSTQVRSLRPAGLTTHKPGNSHPSLEPSSQSTIALSLSPWLRVLQSERT